MNNLNQEYNGYTNYATWNVCLWVDNEYALYQAKVDALHREVRGLDEEDLADWEFTAKEAESLYTDLLGGTTPDLEEGDWDNVDWEQVAEELTIEGRELAAV